MDKEENTDRQERLNQMRAFQETHSKEEVYQLKKEALMLAYITASPATKPINRVINTAERLSELGTIPQIKENRDLLQQVQSDDFWQEANIVDLDEVREVMRDLVKFLEKVHRKDYYTNFKDEFEVINEGKGNFYGANDLQNYRKRVSQYLKEHQDRMAIYKLHHNKALTKQDVKQLEYILWEELGTKEDYKKEFGETPITRLVRQTVGLDRKSALDAFSEFLSEERLNSHQIKFVHLIIDYIVSNGYLEKKVLREDPFRSLGSITELFEDKIEDAKGIINVIDRINNNSNFTEGA